MYKRDNFRRQPASHGPLYWPGQNEMPNINTDGFGASCVCGGGFDPEWNLTLTVILQCQKRSCMEFDTDGDFAVSKTILNGI